MSTYLFYFKSKNDVRKHTISDCKQKDIFINLVIIYMRNNHEHIIQLNNSKFDNDLYFLQVFYFTSVTQS